MMTRLLEQAVAEAAALPADVQDRIASQLLQEIRAAQWQVTLQSADSLAVLDAWAAEALRDLKKGAVEPIRCDTG
jgi:hypothetical protein